MKIDTAKLHIAADRLVEIGGFLHASLTAIAAESDDVLLYATALIKRHAERDALYALRCPADSDIGEVRQLSDRAEALDGLCRSRTLSHEVCSEWDALVASVPWLEAVRLRRINEFTDALEASVESN